MILLNYFIETILSKTFFYKYRILASLQLRRPQLQLLELPLLQPPRKKRKKSLQKSLMMTWVSVCSTNVFACSFLICRALIS